MSATADRCPCCGCKLDRDEPLEVGNVRIENAGVIHFRGRKVNLRRSQGVVVDALVRARGRYLSRGTLAGIVNEEIDDASIKQYILRARSAFRAIDPNFDQIETLHGFGAYRWRVGARAS